MRDSHPARQRASLPGRQAKLTITAVAVIAGLFAAGCSSGGTGQAGLGSKVAATKSQAPAAQIAITPASGSHNVKPEQGVTVEASNGKLTSVSVSAGGKTVAGTMAAAGNLWQSNGPLTTSTHYTVTATAAGTDGKTVTQTSSFSTMTADGTYTVSTILGYQMTYGVGMPIVLNFDTPVASAYKAGVEKAIQITSSKPVVGAWYWDGDQTLAFRPQNYWPADTQVSFSGHFTGVPIAPGVYGSADLSQSFKIGPSLIVVASTRTHYMKVYYQGKLYGNWPISTGQPGLDTANGTYLTIEKGNPTRMKGNGYDELVPYAVRFTWSGNYIHDAYWSVAQQGYVNVSHGCINVSPAHSVTYFNWATPGDPVTVTGSPVAGQWDDGYTWWFLSWDQLLKGSATHQAIQVGPTGSAMVNPSTLSSSPASSILDGPKPWNYLTGNR